MLITPEEVDQAVKKSTQYTAGTLVEQEGGLRRTRSVRRSSPALANRRFRVEVDRFAKIVELTENR